MGHLFSNHCMFLSHLVSFWHMRLNISSDACENIMKSVSKRTIRSHSLRPYEKEWHCIAAFLFIGDFLSNDNVHSLRCTNVCDCMCARSGPFHSTEPKVTCFSSVLRWRRDLCSTSGFRRHFHIDARRMSFALEMRSSVIFLIVRQMAAFSCLA